jgi:hypothetical protein
MALIKIGKLFKITVALLKNIRLGWKVARDEHSSLFAEHCDKFPASSNVPDLGVSLPFEVLHSRVGSWPYPQTLD